MTVEELRIKSPCGQSQTMPIPPYEGDFPIRIYRDLATDIIHHFACDLDHKWRRICSGNVVCLVESVNRVIVAGYG